MSGHGGQTFITAYCASKGALATLTKGVAFCVMRNRIRVNGLNIGWMDTPGENRIQQTYHGAQRTGSPRREAGTPVGRLLKPTEVARAVAYLASRERADDRIDHRLRSAGAGRGGDRRLAVGQAFSLTGKPGDRAASLGRCTLSSGSAPAA